MSFDPNISVLIVDDYKTMLRVIRTLLGQIGITNVEEATDGGRAAEIMRGHTFDLIISDWNMEPVSGIDLLRQVRAGQAGGGNTNVPFIMVTAENKVENIVAAKQAGVNNYIVKPFSAATLREKIEAVMKKKDGA